MDSFGLITADLPYGTQQKDHVRDPVLTDSQCDTVAAGTHKVAADRCVTVLGCGTADQVAQWKKAMTGAGWNTENDARVVIHTKSHARQKTGYHTMNRRKNTISTIANCHYWLVCYKGYDNGVFPWDERFAFGFMDTAMSGLKSTVLTENPAIPPHYRLVDKFGSPLNPYEKHLGEVVEQLTRFTDRDAMVLDFCSGTGSAALACLYMNQRFVVCNDRDKEQVKHAEARAKAYLSAMMSSKMWDSWGSDAANPYHHPGYAVHKKWDGQDPYLPLLAAAATKINGSKSICVPHNIPRSTTLEKQQELFGCVVGPSEEHGISERGVYLVFPQVEGTAFPLFGEWKRRARKAQVEGQLHSILVRPRPGETTPFILKVSDKCPFLHVRSPSSVDEENFPDKEDLAGVNPDDRAKANCVVEENRCGMEDLYKLCLVLTDDILDASTDNPVQLLCKYEFLELVKGWKGHVPANKRKAVDAINRTSKVAAEGATDEEKEEEAQTVVEPAKKKRKRRRIRDSPSETDSESDGESAGAEQHDGDHTPA